MSASSAFQQVRHAARASERGRFVAFVLVGGFCSLVNLVARIVFNLATNYEVAIVLAFCVATTTAFLLNRIFVFDAQAGEWRRHSFRFLLVNLLTLLQVFLLTELFARIVFPWIGFHWHGDTVAHGIGLLSPILTSYWAHKHYSFAQTGATDRQGE